MQKSSSVISKFSRRVGYGLKPGELIPDDPVTWAVKQIENIPQLGIPQPDGTDLLNSEGFVANRDYLPIPEMSDAVELWGKLHNRWLDINKLASEMPPHEWQDLMYREVYFRRADIVQWRDCLVRSSTAAHGQSGVFEKFWTFWVNHFAVHARHFTKLFYGPHTRIIREHMLGNFSDLARAAILNPSMLEYLDNIFSSGPNSFMVKNRWDPGATINENLGREVLELHTIGIESGYSQKDVTEMAYALTGWGIYSGKNDEFERLAIRGQSFGTYFEPRRHEPGSRNIFGIEISQNDSGMSQAPLAIDVLSRRAETIERISRKLATYFISDEPPQGAIDEISKVWKDTDGSLPDIHRVVIEQCFKHIEDTQKLTTPEEWLFTLYRTTGLPVPSSAPGQPGLLINNVCDELGQSYDEVPQPDGWPANSASWLSSAFLERRFRFVNFIANSRDITVNNVEIIKEILYRDYHSDQPGSIKPEDLIAAIEARSPVFGQLKRDMFMTYACSPQFLYM